MSKDTVQFYFDSFLYINTISILLVLTVTGNIVLDYPDSRSSLFQYRVQEVVKQDQEVAKEETRDGSYSYRDHTGVQVTVRRGYNNH